jgi:hypothetical protein
MGKIKILFKETFFLTKKHKTYLLLPLLLFLVLLSLIIYHVGPKVVITFIYAGV